MGNFTMWEKYELVNSRKVWLFNLDITGTLTYGSVQNQYVKIRVYEIYSKILKISIFLIKADTDLKNLVDRS